MVLGNRIIKTLILIGIITVIMSFSFENDYRYYIPFNFYKSVSQNDTNFKLLAPIRCITYIKGKYVLSGYRCIDLYGAQSISCKRFKDSTVYKIGYPIMVCKEDLNIDTINFWDKNNEIYIVVHSKSSLIELLSLNKLNKKKISIKFKQIEKRPGFGFNNSDISKFSF